MSTSTLNTPSAVDIKSAVNIKSTAYTKNTKTSRASAAARKGNGRQSVAPKSTQSTSPNATPLTQWLTLSREELDAIYKQAKPGAIPQGDTRGTAILAGGLLPRLFAGLARFAWQGKVFDLFSPACNNGVVVNKISPLGLNLIVAKTYREPSWMDGKDTIVIDYSTTSLFARRIRDEIREVSPGLYLGKVWFGKTRILDFALETHQPD